MSDRVKRVPPSRPVRGNVTYTYVPIALRVCTSRVSCINSMYFIVRERTRNRDTSAFASRKRYSRYLISTYSQPISFFIALKANILVFCSDRILTIERILTIVVRIEYRATFVCCKIAYGQTRGSRERERSHHRVRVDAR